MTAERPKVFGMTIGVDPKLIILGLIVVAGIIFYFTSSSSDGSTANSSSAPSAIAPATARPALNLSMAARAARRSHVAVDRDVLKLVAVDGSRGDVDPTLRLGLLDRVKNVPPASGLRNLFDAGGALMAQNTPMPMPKNVPILPPKPIMPVMPVIAQPATPVFTIPLKYYGFAKSKGRSVDGSRGLFLDGDNILIGGEGDVLEKHFLIVALTPTSARLEDTQAKQRQDLPVTPEAPTTQ